MASEYSSICCRNSSVPSTNLVAERVLSRGASNTSTTWTGGAWVSVWTFNGNESDMTAGEQRRFDDTCLQQVAGGKGLANDQGGCCVHDSP